MALTCPDEDALRKLAARLSAAGVRHRTIIESDGAFAGRLMAIGLEPGPRKELKRHLSALPLLK